MANFSGLNTALSGLLAHKRAIDVIGQNIANVNTEGYSRRQVKLEPSVGLVSPGMYSSNWASGNLGVDVASVNRIRDTFLDAKARTEMANDGSARTLENILSRVEATFPEPSDTAIAGQLSAFWNSFADAANNPSSIPARTAVLAQATTLVDTFAKAAADLKDLHADIDSRLTMTISEVNSAAKRVGDLNRQIRLATATGVDTGDLADQRDLLIDDLTRAVGATTKTNEFGQVDVIVGGTALVHGVVAEELAVVDNGSLQPPLDSLPLQQQQLRWARDGYPVTGYGGEVGALLQGVNDMVPRYMNQLDALAANLVSTTNAVHSTGQGQDPVNDLNLNFFDPAATTASSLAVSANIAGQPSRVALATAGGGALNGTIGHQIGALGSLANGPDAMHRTLMGRLGVEAQTASDRAELQMRISTDANNQRTAVSGVNLDEEMTNLVMSQRAYESSARLLTTIDEMLDVLINRTGVVGR